MPKRTIVPVDMGGSQSRCVISPPGQVPPKAETVRALIAHYEAERAPQGSDVEVGFFRGGVPGPDLLDACQDYPIRVSCNPADLSRQDALRLHSAGVQTIELEVFSLDPYVLRSNSRDYTVARILGMFRVLSEMGLKVGVHLVPGLPGGDEETSMADVRVLIESGHVDFVRLWPALAFEGATLAQWVQEGRWNPPEVPAMVALLERMMDGLEAAGIPVVRVGLHPGQDVPAELIAGPYHPNLRGEVETRRFGRRMMAALADRDTGPSPVIRVHPKDIGWAKGTSNTNARMIRTRLGLVELKIVSDPDVSRGTVAVGEAG